ncbi:MAG TPA: hypothetical protein VLB80_01420 [Candidatus Babeliales bacterium]|nr:hypothetical protein [Candidatus Babeliales bacterium]
MKKVIISIFAFLIFSSDIIGRSHFRKKDKDIPKITIGWKNSKKKISRTNWAYKAYPMFTVFNHEYFYKNILPNDVINYTNKQNEFVDCQTLNNIIEKLLKEVKKQKRQYTHFDILKNSNFNHKKQCGLLILKFKNYPFVLKLFMETPTSFIDPYCKGFENQFFFYMSGGMNRHIAGLTRIRNLELVKNQIDNSTRWKNKVITPRKWYWIPKKHRFIQINGYNIGGEKKEISTLMPSVYAIIADAIDTTEDAPLLSSQQKSELIMELCMDLHLFVDPHADNFVIKYQPKINDYYISIVDTEHFPSIVGLQEEPFFNNHLEWYLYLGAKYFQDAFLQTKNDRREAQCKINPYALKW